MLTLHKIFFASIAGILAASVLQQSATAATFNLVGYAGTSSASDQTASSTDGSAINLVIPNTLDDPSIRTSTASGSVSTGVVSVTAESAVLAGTPSIGDIQSRMTGGWIESMTITAPGVAVGTAGVASFGVDIDGFLDGSGESFRAYYSTSLAAGTSFDSEGNVDGTRVSANGELLTYDSDNVNPDGTLGTTRIEFIDLPITFGEAFNVQFVLTTIAEISFEGDASELTYAYGDLGRTAIWGGFTSVKDQSGNVITEFSVENADGVDFKNAIEVAPVPLPAGVWLLLSALSGLGLLGWRRPRGGRWAAL